MTSDRTRLWPAPPQDRPHQDRPHQDRPYRRTRQRRAYAIAVACALAVSALPTVAAAGKPKHADQRAGKGPFGDIPKGPLQIVISIDQQKLHLYSDGAEVADTSVATGVREHPTPSGIFSIIQKSRYHRSNIYSDAPMPYMQRITWSGVALHEGRNLGHPASHGCVRLSEDFAVRLWALTRTGARVIIARPELKPAPFADARLFVHADKPAPPAAGAAGATKPVQTAQTAEEGKVTDAATERTAGNAAHPLAAADGADAKSSAPTKADDPPPAVADTDARDNNTSGNNAADAASANQPPPALPSAPTEPATASANPADQPLSTPIELARLPSKAAIAVFISRKTKKIYVRQDFAPLFKAPVVIEDPERPLGTHVFTALEYQDDHATFRWNVVSLPGEPSKPARTADIDERNANGKRRNERANAAAYPPPQTPEQALARITIPQDAIDQIAPLMTPGSSLIISDQGLGDETGEGTDFIVVAHEERPSSAGDADRDRARSPHHHRHMHIYYWW
jgi:L,D-transpeptidase-like protein